MRLNVSRRDFATLLAGASATALCGSTAIGQSRETVTIAYPVDVPTWDPTAVTFPSGQSIYKSVFDSPLTFSPNHELLPKQIRSWKWIDDSYQRLEVELRDGILFHDGSSLTTEDLRFSLIERPQKDRRLAAAGILAPLRDIEIASPTKATLVYGSSAVTAPMYLAFMSAYILPKAYFERVGAEGFLSKPVGAGPYRLKDYQRGSRIVLEAFEKYWGGTPVVQEVIFQVLPEAATRVAAIESGRADVSVQIALRETARLERDQKLNVKLYPQAEVLMLQMPSYVEGFKDDNVRRALHLSIDKAALGKAFFRGVARPLSMVAVPGSIEDDPSFAIPFDPKAASDALSTAGYGPSKPLNITLMCTNGTYPNDYDVARAITGMWKQIGVQAQIEEVTVAKYLDLSHGSKLTGMMLYAWSNPFGDPENTVGRVLDPRLRFSTWKDPALTERVEKLTAMPMGDARTAAYRAFAQEASTKSWCIPLLQLVGNVVSKRKIDIPTYEAGYVLPAEFKLM